MTLCAKESHLESFVVRENNQLTVEMKLSADLLCLE